jgi:hypothetical protein
MSPAARAEQRELRASRVSLVAEGAALPAGEHH